MRQKTLAQHDQREMPMQAIPAAALIVVQATLALGVLKASWRVSTGRGLTYHLPAPRAPGTGRSPRSHPSGPVETRAWLVAHCSSPVAQWTRTATHRDDALVRVAPFDAIELDLTVLWAK